VYDTFKDTSVRESSDWKLDDVYDPGVFVGSGFLYAGQTKVDYCGLLLGKLVLV